MISNPNPTAPDAGHRADLKLSASKMRGAVRRAFQAAMAVNDCAGSPRQTESVFGWSCHAVELGLHERRTGLVCLSVQSAFGGDNLWEEKHPAAAVLWELAEAHSQRDPTFRTTQSFTRLAAAEALRQLRARHRRGRAAVTEYDGRGPGPQRLPAASGARGQTPKKVPQTDAIFDNLRAKDQCGEDGHVARLSIDCKATVKIGEYSRGGCTRGDTKAADHDMGCHETYTPFGLVNEDTGVLHLTFGRSAKTSDCIVDGLHAWWEQQPPEQRERITLVRIKAWLLTVADIRDWTSPNAAGRACTVASIHDGDTLRAVCDGERLQVRLYCIDAPEMSQAPRGARAEIICGA
jgi:hypothetical protein